MDNEVDSEAPTQGTGMEAKKVYELAGERIHSLEDFWTVMGEAINGPGGYFGSNLDAFADCLSGGFGTSKFGGYIIRWSNSTLSKAALGYPETVRQLEWRLERCHPENRFRVRGQLWDAQRGQGPTVFDWLVEIVNQEPSAGLETV
jgi:hypothetical protein